MDTLLVLDCDGTLCDSSAANSLLPPTNESRFSDYAKWHDCIAHGDFPLIRGAKSGAEALLSTYGAVPVLLSSRSVMLAEATRSWLVKHVTVLGEADILLRPLDDEDPAWMSKVRRLREYRLRYPGWVVIIVDDDALMRAGCDERGDRFIRVDGSWENLVEIPCCDELKVLWGEKPHE